MTAIRPTAFAGRFYPADAAQLAQQVDAYLGQAGARVTGRAQTPKALIAPHAGYVYSGPVAANAYALLAGGRDIITRVVLLGPSHRIAFRGMAVSAADFWASPLGEVPIDRAAIAALQGVPMLGTLDAAHAQEHSLEVHLPFLQRCLTKFSVVPVLVGDARPEEVAALLDAAWGGPETLIVVSTDLSHYLDYPSCQKADAASVAAIERLDPDSLGRDQACGRIPVGGLLLTAKRRAMEIVTLDVRKSGDTAGPKDRVVGYGSWALYPPAPTDQPGDDPIRAAGALLKHLAWASIRVGLETGHPAKEGLTADMPALMGQAGAVFVTLKRNGQLRGCIGSAIAWRPLLDDITDNAFKAAFKDPRFPPLRAEDLQGLDLSVSVLTPPVPMNFADQADLLAQLRPRIDGLIIEDGGRRALFLPSVWEQLPDKGQFLAHLKQKAGMPVNHWSTGFKASRFQAVEIK
jgi:AmmeMemoRadiSam system protein B/AmmeMemoRadiSam system protein A